MTARLILATVSLVFVLLATRVEAAEVTIQYVIRPGDSEEREFDRNFFDYDDYTVVAESSSASTITVRTYTKARGWETVDELQTSSTNPRATTQFTIDTDAVDQFQMESDTRVTKVGAVVQCNEVAAPCIGRITVTVNIRPGRIIFVVLIALFGLMLVGMVASCIAWCCCHWHSSEIKAEAKLDGAPTIGHPSVSNRASLVVTLILTTLGTFFVLLSFIPPYYPQYFVAVVLFFVAALWAIMSRCVPCSCLACCSDKDVQELEELPYKHNWRSLGIGAACLCPLLFVLSVLGLFATAWPLEKYAWAANVVITVLWFFLVFMYFSMTHSWCCCVCGRKSPKFTHRSPVATSTHPV